MVFSITDLIVPEEGTDYWKHSLQPLKWNVPKGVLYEWEYDGNVVSDSFIYYPPKCFDKFDITLTLITSDGTRCSKTQSMDLYDD